MTHDDTKSARDVAFRMAGIGMAHTFRCGRCDQPRSSRGRRLEKVKGLVTYVCAGCKKGAGK